MLFNCRKITCLLTVCLVLLNVVPVSALTGILHDYAKLTNSSVNNVCQDKYGYIWVSSEFGLNRFDGYRFVKYFSRSCDSTSICDNTVKTMLCSSSGEMLVGSASGMMSYDYATDGFRRIKFPGNIKPFVNTLLQMSSGKVLVGTAGYGVYLYSANSDKVERISGFSVLGKSDHLSFFFLENVSTLWCSTKDGVILRFTLKGDLPVSCDRFEWKGIMPKAILKNKKGKVLFVMGDGIAKYDAGQRRLVDAGYELPSDGQITSAYCDKDYNIYIGTLGYGLRIIRCGETKAVDVPMYNGHYRMKDLVVNSVFEDRDRNLWVSCPHRGVYVSSKTKPVFLSTDMNVTGQRVSFGFASLCPSSDGGVYGVALYRGLFHVDRQGNASYFDGISGDASCIFRSSSGSYWLGTWHGLYAFDPLTNKSRLVKPIRKGVCAIGEDKRGNLYLSVLGEGFAKYNPATDEIRYYNIRSHGNAKGVKFDNDWVGSFYCDSRGYVWIPTSSGVWCYNPDDDTFVDLGDHDGILRNLNCFCLCEIRGGDIVIGTVRGLYLYSRSKKTTCSLPGAEQLEDMNITGLVRDSFGDIWISTKRGLWAYSTATSRLISYLDSNGIADNEFCNGAYCQTPDGIVHFGSNSYITSFNPRDVKQSFVTSRKIQLTRFTINNRVENPFADSYVIPWDENRFSMEFSLLEYFNRSGVTFEYRINGCCEWIPFDNEGNILNFTKLKSGKYVIEVRVANNGDNPDNVKRITVFVQSPWYSSPMAITIYIIIGVSILVLLASYYYRQQRIRIDEEKMKLLINATHDIRSPLTLILSPLAKMKNLLGKSVDDNFRSEMDGYLNVVERNADRLLLLVNQILDMRKIDKNQMRLQCRETDMVEFIERSFRMFEYNARQKGYDFTFDHPGGMTITAWIDRLHFEKVVINLLSNAFKYTSDGGQVKVELAKDAKWITLRVIDSGVGISEQKPSRLFDRFYQGAANEISGIPGTGIGLNLARNVVELHGGTITAANRKDGLQGACFTVKIPVGNAHLRGDEIYNPKESEMANKKIISRKSKIMIVDDDEELAAYTARELRQWYKTDVFNDADSAFKSLVSGDYDLVVSDVIMPVTDGITLLKKIKGSPLTSHIPVILLTSKSEVEDRLSGFKSGADAYISKPFSCELLHTRIDNLVDNMRRLKGKFSGTQQQLDKVEQVKVKGYDDELMKRVMKSVNHHLSDTDFTVDVLASEVGMSRVQLHRKLKEITGLSTGKFIRNIRMEQAGRLIKEGKTNISHIAYSVGFNDQTYFSTLFKQYYGMSPTEYAKTQCD